MTKMRSVRFHGPKDLRLETIERPNPGPGEVLVRIEAALTCGTDFKAYRQGHPVLLNNKLPSPFGHEFAGVITEVGSGVSKFSVGQRVVAANSAPCDACVDCDEGNPGLCENLQLLNGAYAEYIVIPKQIVKHNLYLLPEAMPFEVAALAEPLACVVRAFEKLEMKRGQTLAILGAGLMGLFFTALAKREGVEVIAIGRSAEKLELAKAFGARAAISTLDHPTWMEEVRKLTPHGRGADATVEAIGQAESWAQAVALTRKGGTVCLYGGCAKGSSFSLDTHRVHYGELKIFGVFHHSPKHFAKALELLGEGFLKTDLLLRQQISLTDLPEHFARKVTTPFYKIVVIPTK